jgi:hypothetical protein
MYYGDALAMYQLFGYFHTLENCAGFSREEVRNVWFDMVRNDVSTADMYAYLHHQSNGRIVLDKTPLLPIYGQSKLVLRTLLEYEPVFIYLVRNPLAVISSFQKTFIGTLRRMDVKRKTNPKIFPDHWQYFKAAGEVSPFRFYESMWVHSNLAIREFLEEVPAQRVCQLTFEEFLQDPEKLLRLICHMLAIDYSPEMTQIHKIRKPTFTHREIFRMIWRYEVPVGDPSRLWTRENQSSISSGRTQASRQEWDQLLPETQKLAQSFGFTA